MNKNYFFFFINLILLGLTFSIYQYVNIFKAEIVGAADTKPTNGHSWTEMESDSDSIQVNGQIITNLATPTNNTDAANKAYVDGNGGVPSGAIMMFAAACPTGWTRFSALDGSFPRGASTYGSTGGSSTHTHTLGSHTHGFSGATDLPGSYYNGTWAQANTVYHDIQGTNLHSHAFSGTTGAASGATGSYSSLPPYLDVIYCQKN